MRRMLRKIGRLYIRTRQIPGTDHKPWLRIIIELVICIVARRLEASLYFEGKVFLKDRKIRDFISNREFRELIRAHNSPHYYPILEDKYIFDQILQGKSFRSPRNRFILSRGAVLEYGSGCEIQPGDLLKNELDGFCKLINGFGGHSIYKLSVTGGRLRINDEGTTIDDFIRKLGEKEFLIQEKVHQHPLMNELNPFCLNTLRLVTVQNGKEIVNLKGYLRVGINNNFVDNGLSGNIFVGFDQESGILMEHAHTDGPDIISQILERHPQTQKSFHGFRIPYFTEACNMVRELHRLFRQFFIVGWDIGITEEGPVVIEGNNITELYNIQILYGGIRSPLMGHLIKYRKDL
jgi:hypothetical protein